MSNKRTLYLDVLTTTADPQHGVILSIAAIMDKKTKKNPISTFQALVTPTPMQWLWSEPALLAQSDLTWDKLQEEGRPWPEVRSEFADWLRGNLVLSNKAEVLAYDAPRVLGFLERYLHQELEFAHFPFDYVFDLRDYYSILVNRRVMPLLTDRNLQAICQALQVHLLPDHPPVSHRADAIKECYEKMLELGVRE